jgi:hypothetical protein
MVERNKKTMIEPLEKQGLFKHCTGGFSCVDFKEFTKETIPVLHAHGIQMITYEGAQDVNK